MGQTIRQMILDMLLEGPVSALKISGAVGIPAKEVAFHLTHIEKTLQQSGGRMLIIPAACRHCGFLFVERRRKTKPGKCPQCQSSFIGEPLFAARMTR
jgi:predicted Zn-ribbon and HTH transcriptional regulator